MQSGCVLHSKYTLTKDDTNSFQARHTDVQLKIKGMLMMILDTNKTRVIILTGHYRIVGQISVLPESRVTDFICDSKDFIAVTDAEIWDLGQRKVASTNFMNINREHIEIIMPEDSVTQGVGLPLAHARM